MKGRTYACISYTDIVKKWPDITRREISIVAWKGYAYWSVMFLEKVRTLTRNSPNMIMGLQNGFNKWTEMWRDFFHDT